MNPNQNKFKMYLSIGLIMVVIVTAWLLNLKNSLTSDKSNQTASANDLALDQKWSQFSTDLGKLITNIKVLGSSLNQSATTSASDLQAAAKIKPSELEELIDKLKIEISSSTKTNFEFATSTIK